MPQSVLYLEVETSAILHAMGCNPARHGLQHKIMSDLSKLSDYRVNCTIFSIVIVHISQDGRIIDTAIFQYIHTYVCTYL